MSDSDIRPDDDVFDVDRIRRLVELMEGHDLREIDLRQNEQRIRLCRGAEVTYVPPVAMPSGPAPAPAHPLPPASGRRPAAPGPAAVPEPVDENIVIIKSPMVGTFYARANPNAEPYVKVGDMVEAGNDDLHHRGDEGLQRDPGGDARQDRRRAGRRRGTGRSRSPAVQGGHQCQLMHCDDASHSYSGARRVGVRAQSSTCGTALAARLD